MLKIDGLEFRDLDHDGVLAPFEDWRLDAHIRSDDLLQRMTLEEKIGLLFHGTAFTDGPLGELGIGSEYDQAGIEDLIAKRHINHMITRLGIAPSALAAQNNRLQKIAAETRLGIPVTVSTDPRHHFQFTTGASLRSSGFSVWPEALGMAALRDTQLMKQFADIARQEYRAVGIQMALSPMADLATSPKWPRINGTFGEDPVLVNQLVQAYIQGLQGSDTGVDKSGVACVVKHWVGYGAAVDGFDGHNSYGRYAELSWDTLQKHIQAFDGAFEAGVSGLMPTYNILRCNGPDGSAMEDVGAGFNRYLITDLLRGEKQFKGVVLSDWAIYRDATRETLTGNPRQTPATIAMCWGVEELTPAQRVAKSMLAGVDQLGGEDEPAIVFTALEEGLIDETLIDHSARRILIEKFKLGLFEDPFVDASMAEQLVGKEEFIELAEQCQRNAMVIVEGFKSIQGQRVYLHGVAADAFSEVEVVPNVDEADVAIVRLQTPFQTLHPEFFFGSMQHEGDLDFKPGSDEYDLLASLSAEAPVILVMNMDRPAVLSSIKDFVAGIIVEFGADDFAVADVVTHPELAKGCLPLELPYSMSAVNDKPVDLPASGDKPLYPLFYRAS
ncbi:MAG: glycoside hydrolase family 3 N-terminal domain-containing protein [Pseudomonadales bacterium]